MAQREEKEMDYLEPFLVQLNVDDVKNVALTRQQALKLRDDCMADLKQRLIDKANTIQGRFEKVHRSCLHVYSGIFCDFISHLFSYVNINVYWW